MTNVVDIFFRVRTEKEKLIELREGLRSIKDARSEAAIQVRKEIDTRREQIRGLTRFKGEWLSMMFIAQAVAKPFQSLIDSTLKLTGLFEVFGAIFNILLLPVLLPFVQVMISIGQWMLKNKETVGKLVAALVIFGAIFAGIFGVISMIIIAVGAIIAAGSAGFVLLVAAIIAGLAAVITILLVWGKDIWNFFKNVFQVVGDIIRKAVDWLLSIFKTYFMDPLFALFDWIAEGITNILEPINDWIDDLLVKIGELWGGVTDFFGGIGEGIADFFGGRQFGGEIKNSGLYYLHAGEEVISNSPAGSQGGTFNNINISDVSVADNIDIDLLARRVGNRLGRMA